VRLPENFPMPYSSLISDIEKGQIRIPQFQRDFVWSKQKSAALIDSIIKGYPIGTFIFWRTKDRLRSIRSIGGIEVPELKEEEFVDFVLDGQQRLTSLFASLKGIKIQRENNKVDDYSEIYINLDANEDEAIVITDVEDINGKSLIKLVDLLYGELELLFSYPPEFHPKLSEYKRQIESYAFSIIRITEVSIDVATEIFTRINVGGKPLTLFEIMVAKTFDFEKNFDLSEKYNDLINNLKIIDYETISDATVLQTISILLEKECKRKTILKLPKKRFIEIWDDAMDAIERAVEYFKSFYRIPVSQLLPYNALVVPFAYFFFHHKDKPTGDKQKYLEDFFWRCSLSGRYSSSVESKLAQDIKRIDKILKGKLPKYDWPIDSSPDFIIENGWFSAGRSYVKAILSIYAYHQPKSFNDDSIVNISNYWLKQANSKNYHHFFPKAYLKKNGEEEFYINHILNITIVDDFLNKREIRAQAPSKYMSKFKQQNPKLEQTMKTHLICDMDLFGIWEDDYDKFFEERAKVVSKEITKRIIRQDIDKKQQEDVIDDYEEEPTSVE